MALLKDTPNYSNYIYHSADNPRQINGIPLIGIRAGVWCGNCVKRIIDLILLGYSKFGEKYSGKILSHFLFLNLNDR